MRYFSYFIYMLLQCTWGFLQTLAGLAYFLVSIKYPHSFYHGAILTYRDGIGGVSLGMFIFASDCKERERIAVHEFGHTIQSLILGPLYLFIIGTVSGCWCRLPVFVRMRRERNISYNACFTESWANYCGERVLNEPSTREIE